MKQGSASLRPKTSDAAVHCTRRCTTHFSKMNKIEIYVANEDTDINPSVQEAIEYVLKQNDPVGTVAGYYDEKLTIWSVSNYFLQLLGWDDLDEFMKASDGSMLSKFIATYLQSGRYPHRRYFSGR